MATTRFAPSPTGALHLGNARTFLVNWLLAKQKGWRIILRIDDLDGPRTKKDADRQAIQDLQWLGLNWDTGPVYQSPRAALYTVAIQQLLQSGRAYPCICTRKEVELAASAPHAEDGAAIYPGTCRGRFDTIEQAQRAAGRPPAIRFKVPSGEITFTDQFKGPCRFDPPRQQGDFVIAKADGTAAYQLAVVIDDAEASITHVVRGDDLLDSTPRQILLYRALGLTEKIPHYCHLPLITGLDGKRLAKRHGDSRLSYYRNQGVKAERILQLLARWCNIKVSSPTLQNLMESFDLAAIPRLPIALTPDDEQFLIS